MKELGASDSTGFHGAAGFVTLQDQILTAVTPPGCIYLVVVDHSPIGNGVLWNAYIDESKAVRAAQALSGVVATVPITHDFRR